MTTREHPHLATAAPWADEPLGPARRRQVLKACLLAREPLLELHDRAREVWPGHRRTVEPSPDGTGYAQGPKRPTGASGVDLASGDAAYKNPGLQVFSWMARPGLEPGTPRFSVVGASRANVAAVQREREGMSPGGMSELSPAFRTVTRHSGT